MPSQVTNGNFDTALTAFHAAWPSVFGAYTRTDAVVDADPNSHMPITVTTALSTTFEISYDELVDTAVAKRIVLEAHKGTNQNYELDEIEPTLTALADAINADANNLHTDAFYTQVIKSLVRIVPAEAFTRFRDYHDFDPMASVTPVITWTAVDGGSQEIDFSFTGITGSEIILLVVNINDGEHVLVGDADIPDTSVLMAGGVGSYDVVVTAITANGVVRETLTVVVA